MTSAGHLVLPLRLHLAYAHGLGGLSPYFAGLLEGRAMATRCPRCSKAWCPPHPTCPSDGAATDWIALAGTGTLLSATETTITLPLTDASRACIMALARLDGAENAMLARMEPAPGAAIPKPGTRIKLARAPGEWPHPAQSALFVPI